VNVYGSAYRPYAGAAAGVAVGTAAAASAYASYPPYYEDPCGSLCD